MKLKAAYETDIHIDNDGYYRISQYFPGEESSVILLTREQVKLVQDDMLDRLALSEWGIVGEIRNGEV